MKSRVERTISRELTLKPRFSEVDAMSVVWHGNYVQYLEDAREELGRAHGMGYMDVYRNGFMLPVVKMELDYKSRITYEDEILIRCRLHETAAAKVKFTYEVWSKKDMTLCATAETIQVFIDLEGELQLIFPQFYENWKSGLPWEDPAP